MRQPISVETDFIICRHWPRSATFSFIMLMVRLALAVSLLVATSNAFIVAPPKLAANAVVGAPLLRQHPRVLLQMSSEGEQKQPQSPTEETLEEEEEEEVEQEVEQVKEEQVKENPEITALKQEIASLESTLKASQQNIAYQTEKLEQYSKAGYARRVAEMETMRRARSVCFLFCKQECVCGIHAPCTIEWLRFAHMYTYSLFYSTCFSKSIRLLEKQQSLPCCKISCRYWMT
jgi:flagellar motor protein MotB